MSAYNILFPFLIILVLGFVIFILARHYPEAVEHEEAPIKKEGKRWWQIFWGKGENVLRYLRLVVLKIDNKLNDSIKKARAKKEQLGESLKEYRERKKIKGQEGQDKGEEMAAENEKPSQEDFGVAKKEETSDQKVDIVPYSSSLPKEEQKTAKKEISNFRRGVSGAFKVFRKKKEEEVTPSVSKVSEEQAPKTRTFTPAEIKVERSYYLRKKEEMLIKSIVNDPKNVNLYLQLGRIYINQKNFEDAQNAFLEVLKLDKTNIKAKEELKRIEKSAKQETWKM